MPNFSNIAKPELVTSQAGHALTANEAIEALAKGAGVISVSLTAGSVPLSEDQSRSGVILLTGAPGAARVVTVDADITRAILFRNDTTGGQVIEVEQTGGTNFAVPAGKSVLLLSTTDAISLTPDPLTLGGTASLGKLTIYPAAIGSKGIVAQALAAQTAALFEAQDSGGTARVLIGSLTAVADHTLALRAITSQTGMLLQLQNAAGTAICGFSAAGNLVNATGVMVIGISTGNQLAQAGSGLVVNPKTTALPALVAVAAASQTGTTAEFRDNGSVARVTIGSLTAVADHTLSLRAITSQTGLAFRTLDAAGTGLLFGVEVDGDLRTSRSAAATTLGAVARKLELFDAAGASIGFLPLYDSIT